MTRHQIIVHYHHSDASDFYQLKDSLSTLNIEAIDLREMFESTEIDDKTIWTFAFRIKWYIILISKDFLKCQNCILKGLHLTRLHNSMVESMYEEKEQDMSKETFYDRLKVKTFPVIIDDFNISNAEYRAEIHDYWLKFEHFIDTQNPGRDSDPNVGIEVDRLLDDIDALIYYHLEELENKQFYPLINYFNQERIAFNNKILIDYREGLKDLEETIISIYQSIKLHPNDPFAWCILPTIASFKADSELSAKAVSHAEKAIEKLDNIRAYLDDKAISSFFFLLGYTYQNSTALINHDSHKTDLAIASYSKAIELSDLAFDPRFMRGLLEYKRDNFHNAVVDFTRAIELNPLVPEAHTNLGLTLTKLKRYNLAETHLTKALSLNPNLAEANVAYAELLFETERYTLLVDIFENKWPYLDQSVAPLINAIIGCAKWHLHSTNETEAWNSAKPHWMEAKKHMPFLSLTLSAHNVYLALIASSTNDPKIIEEINTLNKLN